MSFFNKEKEKVIKIAFKNAKQRKAVMSKLRSFNVEVGRNLKLKSYVMRVEAKNKQAAISKVRRVGFNAGTRQSSGFTGNFKVKKEDVDEIEKSSHN